jgi:hypothetical protein
MSKAEANTLLDRLREGQPVPSYLIELALVATGDKPAEPGHD